MEILNFLNRISQIFQEANLEIENVVNEAKENKLFNVDFSNEDLNFISKTNLSFEELKELTLKQELKTLSIQINTELTQLIQNGAISPEDYEQMQAILEGGITPENINSLKSIASELETPETLEIYTDSTDISSKLDELDFKQKEMILEHVGDISSINSLEILNSGSYKIKTSNNNTIISYASGEIAVAYDDKLKTGFDTYNNENKLKSSFYIDHAKNDTLVYENYQYNDDGSHVETVDTSNEPNIQKIITVDADSNIKSVDIKNRQTGEITPDLEFSQTLKPESSDNFDKSFSGNEDLKDLENQKQEVQNNINENTELKESTEQQKESELGAIDSEISKGENNLSNANNDVNNAQSDVDNAQSDVEDANNNLNDAQNKVDDTQSAVDEATKNVEGAQSNQETASQNNQTAKQEEEKAQTDANKSTDSYNKASQETQNAQNNKNQTAQEVDAAKSATATAFNTKTQADQEVAAAQKKYNTAQAQNGGENKSLWSKIKQAISSAWNSLKNAISKQDDAQIEYEKKLEEQKKKEVIDQKAAEELEAKHEEQETAQTVMNASFVILESKAGAREVSDQELADALLDLADAMLAQDGAIAEHDGALAMYMEANNYTMDAQGNLIDAQGELVSCTQVVQELQEFITILNVTKQETSSQYNKTLDAVVSAINGDYDKLEQLENEIITLQQDIIQKKQELALQEQMLAQLAADKGSINAAENNEAIGDDIAGWFGKGNEDDKKIYKTNRELLEKAIMSGNPDDIRAAYKAIYGEQEVVIDAGGNIVDPNTLTEEQLATCTVAKVSELEGTNLATACQLEQTTAFKSSQMAELLNSGTFTVDGQTINQEDLNEALIKQTEEQIKELEKAIENQGIISKGVNALNKLLGIGTTSDEARAQIEHYKTLTEELKNCTDPTQYAALYKQITGSNFSIEELTQICAYRKMSDMPPASTNQKNNTVPEENQYDISTYVDDVVDTVETTYENNPSVLSKTGNSKANQTVNDYIQTQQNIVEGAKGIVVGLTSVIAATAAVAASPFTGGASLLLLAGVGAATGAATNSVLGAIDSIYDEDNDGKLDFNYTLQEFGSDLITGSITGSVSALTAGLADKTTSLLTSKMSGTIATSGKQAFIQTAAKIGAKSTGEAIEGALDGSLSAFGEYTYGALADGSFNFKDLIKAGGQGALMGSFIGASIGTAGELFSSGKNFVDGAFMKADVDNILTKGGSLEIIDIDDNISIEINHTSPNAGTELGLTGSIDTSANLTLADVIANNLDSKYIKNGKANPWAMSQITQNAKNAQSSLISVGLDNNQALNVLNNVNIENHANISNVTTLLRKNGAELNLLDVDKNVDKDKFSNFIAGLDEVKYNKNGNIESISSYSPNGPKVTLEFDNDGKVVNLKIGENNNNTTTSDDIKILSEDKNIENDNIETPETTANNSTPVDYTNAETGTELPKNEPVLIDGFQTLKLSTYDLDLSSPNIQAKLNSMKEGDIIYVGKNVSGTNDINITGNHVSISDKHLSIQKIGDKFAVIDLSSSGTSIGKPLNHVSYEIKETFGYQTINKVANLEVGEITFYTKNNITYTIENIDGKITITSKKQAPQQNNNLINFDNIKMSNRTPSGKLNPDKSMGELLTPEQKALYCESLQAFNNSRSNKIIHNANNTLTTDNLLHGTLINHVDEILEKGLVPREFSGKLVAKYSNGQNADTLTPLCSDVWDVEENISIKDYFNGNSAHWRKNDGESSFLPNTKNYGSTVVLVFNKKTIDSTLMKNSFIVNSGESILFDKGNMSYGHPNRPTHRAIPIGAPSNAIDRIIINREAIGDMKEILKLKEKISNLGLDIKIYDLYGNLV